MFNHKDNESLILMQVTFMEELYLEKKIDFNAKDNHGWTPIMKTCINGHNDFVKLLFNLKDSKTLTLMLKTIMKRLYLCWQRSTVSKWAIFIEFSTLLDKKKKNSDRCSKLTRPRLNFKNVSSAKGNSTLTAWFAHFFLLTSLLSS